MYKTVLEKKYEEATHAPTLNTILMVEETIKKMNNSITNMAEIKKKLPKQVNHNTLKTILEYLEDSNKILVSMRGISWIHNENHSLKQAITKGREI
jgi:hypothetical protein